MIHSLWSKYLNQNKPLEKFEGDFFQFQTDEDSASISSSLGIKKSASTSRLQKFFGLFK